MIGRFTFPYTVLVDPSKALTTTSLGCNTIPSKSSFSSTVLVTRSEKNRYLLAHEIEWCHYIQWRYVRLCCDFSQQGLDPHQRNRDHCSWLDWQHNSQIGRLRSLEVHAQLSGTSSELWHELLNILAEIALRFWKRCAPVAQQYCNHSCR